MCIIKILF